jgi:NADH-quinone oxidoreductase subunit J
MILVIVYVGAVAVLFLFVVMMLDVDFAELRQGFLQYLPVGTVIGVIFFIELVLVLGAWVVDPAVLRTPMAAIPPADRLTNTEAIGRVLYTQYFYFFQAAGLVLLVAMIGAIVLTLRERVGVKRQDISRQVARTPETAMEVRKVPFRQGI